MKNLGIYFLSCILIISTLSITACSQNSNKVVMEIREYGSITIQLYPDIAPDTVKNFKNYVKDGFYDGLTFYRVVEGSMIQGGDPTGTGFGDSSLTPIKGEFYLNGFVNKLKFTRGVIGMVRSADYNSATSQFFICQQDAPIMDDKYAAFGKVIEGMEVIDAICACEKDDTLDMNGDHTIPKDPIVIEKAYIA